MTGAKTQANARSESASSAIPLGSKAGIPLWRRISAFFTLSFMTVVAGVFLAGILGLTALMILFVLERAIAT